MEKKVDRRVIKTRKQLKNGLAKLMQEKSVNQITVKELVEEVHINRSTFYLHFKDIQDLLWEIEDTMERRIYDPINLFGSLCRIEHHFGSVVCIRAGCRSRRGSKSNGDLAVDFRDRDCRIYLVAMSTVSGSAIRVSMEGGYRR